MYVVMMKCLLYVYYMLLSVSLILFKVPLYSNIGCLTPPLQCGAQNNLIYLNWFFTIFNSALIEFYNQQRRKMINLLSIAKLFKITLGKLKLINEQDSRTTTNRVYNSLRTKFNKNLSAFCYTLRYFGFQRSLRSFVKK